MKSFGRKIPGILLIMVLAAGGTVATRAATTTLSNTSSEGSEMSSSDGVIEVTSLTDSPVDGGTEPTEIPTEPAPPAPAPVPPPAEEPAPAPAPAAPTATVDGRDGAVKLRSGPNGQSSVLISVPGGSIVTLLGSTADAYVRVSYNGTEGYMSRSYLIIN